MLTGALALFVFLLVFTQAENINSLPKGVHQWAQADRYAVAAKYTEGRGFLSPATYSLISDEGEVGVEFPLIQFLAGSMARPENLRPFLPLFYRSLTLLLLIVGLVRLTRRLLPDQPFWSRIAIGILAISSPLLLFYGYNFSPDSAALGLCLLGLSYMDRDFSHFYRILLLFGLAALLKTSSGIYLLAYVGSYTLVHLYKETPVARAWLPKLLATVVVIALIASYDFIYIHLKNKALWSSIFLSQSHPIPDWKTAESVIALLWRWRMEYHTLVQWLLVLPGAFLLIRSLRSGRSSSWVVSFSGLLLLGILSVLFLFGIQFMNHDYYYIATFGPIALVMMLLAIRRLISWRYGWAILLIASVWSFSEGSNQHFDRSSSTCTMKGETHQFEYAWLQTLAGEVDQLIPRGDAVFVIYEQEPNLALSYMDRMGIVFNPEEMGREESNFYYWLQRRQPDFLLCRNQHLTLFMRQHPDFLQRCTLVRETEDYHLYSIHGY